MVLFRLPGFQINYLTTAIVFSCNLCKVDTRSNAEEHPIVIKFVISSFANSDEASSVQMDNAVDQATTSFRNIVSSSSCVDAVDVAGNTISSIDSVLTRTALWEPLLEKIKLCTEIADKIAEVLFRKYFRPIPLTFMTQIHPYAKMAWSVLSVAHKACYRNMLTLTLFLMSRYLYQGNHGTELPRRER
jgi:hypothetical protein